MAGRSPGACTLTGASCEGVVGAYTAIIGRVRHGECCCAGAGCCCKEEEGLTAVPVEGSRRMWRCCSEGAPPLPSVAPAARVAAAVGEASCAAAGQALRLFHPLLQLHELPPQLGKPRAPLRVALQHAVEDAPPPLVGGAEGMYAALDERTGSDVNELSEVVDAMRLFEHDDVKNAEGGHRRQWRQARGRCQEASPTLCCGASPPAAAARSAAAGSP
eukprot:CAMPEP_0174878040 /NCGR_PEP_ID=MMETSP1114-20130205/82560_1 /TAXON_ID=312471 /ORGANISM="Neobodo designis, Strain CCAP 1951/1" /LENGTH=216 /DNA_ID=CAMNT_0016113427 /DNA_START=965 /DNA_END=1613 /DNA_ORIENTATION=-